MAASGKGGRDGESFTLLPLLPGPGPTCSPGAGPVPVECPWQADHIRARLCSNRPMPTSAQAVTSSRPYEDPALGLSATALHDTRARVSYPVGLFLPQTSVPSLDAGPSSSWLHRAGLHFSVPPQYDGLFDGDMCLVPIWTLGSEHRPTLGQCKVSACPRLWNSHQIIGKAVAPHLADPDQPVTVPVTRAALSTGLAAFLACSD